MEIQMKYAQPKAQKNMVRSQQFGNTEKEPPYSLGVNPWDQPHVDEARRIVDAEILREWDLKTGEKSLVDTFARSVAELVGTASNPSSEINSIITVARWLSHRWKSDEGSCREQLTRIEKT